MRKPHIFVILPLVSVAAAQYTITVPCAVTAYTWESTYTTPTTISSTRKVTQTEIYISSVTTTTQRTTENFFAIPSTQLVCGFDTTEVTGLQTRTLLETSVGIATRTSVQSSIVTPASCTSFVVLTTTVTFATEVTDTALPNFRAAI